MYIPASRWDGDGPCASQVPSKAHRWVGRRAAEEGPWWSSPRRPRCAHLYAEGSRSSESTGSVSVCPAGNSSCGTQHSDGLRFHLFSALALCSLSWCPKCAAVRQACRHVPPSSVLETLQAGLLARGGAKLLRATPQDLTGLLLGCAWLQAAAAAAAAAGGKPGRSARAAGAAVSTELLAALTAKLKVRVAMGDLGCVGGVGWGGEAGAMHQAGLEWCLALRLIGVCL